MLGGVIAVSYAPLFGALCFAFFARKMTRNMRRFWALTGSDLGLL